MSKQLLGFIAFIIILSSCKQGRDVFEVHGKITNATGNKVFLSILQPGIKQPLTVDSSTLQKDGSFVLKTLNPKQETLFTLSLENGTEVLLVSDNKKVFVNLDLNNYKSYTTNGSKASSVLHDFLKEYEVSYTKLVEVMKRYDTLKTTDSDSLKTVVRAEKKESLNNVNDLLSLSIKNAGSPALQYYLIAKAFATMPLQQLEQLAVNAQSEFKSYTGFTLLQTIIKAQVAAQPKYELLNKQAPPINLPDTSGKIISLDSLRGKYVLVNFWAGFNKESRLEHADLAAVYRHFRDRNFTMLGVSLDTTRRVWRRAIEEDNLSWKNGSDMKYFSSPVAEAYKVKTLPFNVLLDTAGRVIAFDIKGEMLEDKLEEVIK